MIEPKKLELSSSCRFELWEYNSDMADDLCLIYTEHTTDHWGSDSETDIDITKKKAREIITFLNKWVSEGEQG